MRRIWKPDRDFSYYAGLLLLVGASFSLVWAIWRDAFSPQNFLVYFLLYGWGYLLLFRSDTDYRLSKVEGKMTEVLAKLSFLEEGLRGEENKEEFLVEEGGATEGTTAPRGELFQELWGDHKPESEGEGEGE